MVKHTTFSFGADFYSFEAERPSQERIAQMVKTVQHMGRNSPEHLFAVSEGDTVVIYTKGTDPLLDDVRICRIVSVANKFDTPDIVNENHKQLHNHSSEDILECEQCRPSKRKIRAEMKKIIEK